MSYLCKPQGNVVVKSFSKDGFTSNVSAKRSCTGNAGGKEQGSPHDDEDDEEKVALLAPRLAAIANCISISLSSISYSLSCSSEMGGKVEDVDWGVKRVEVNSGANGLRMCADGVDEEHKMAVDGGTVESVDSGAEKEDVDGGLELVEDGNVGSVDVIESSAETSAATIDVDLREEHEDAIAGDGIVVDVENAEDGLAEPAGHHR